MNLSKTNGNWQTNDKSNRRQGVLVSISRKVLINQQENYKKLVLYSKNVIGNATQPKIIFVS